jgi:hypothetical protein
VLSEDEGGVNEEGLPEVAAGQMDFTLLGRVHAKERAEARKYRADKRAAGEMYTSDEIHSSESIASNETLVPLAHGYQAIVPRKEAHKMRRRKRHKRHS